MSVRLLAREMGAVLECNEDNCDALRAVVLAEEAPAKGKTHRIRWYARRKGSARAGVKHRGRR